MNSLCLDFFQKKVLFDVRPNIHIVQCNIVSTCAGLKKYIQACNVHVSVHQYSFFIS